MYHIDFLPHTADIRMHVEASTLEELFEAALQGMNSVLYSGDAQYDGILYTLRIAALDRTVLLIDFLSEVLTMCYEQRKILDTLYIQELNETSIVAELTGYPVQQWDEDIKAVTYHEANVHHNAKGNWETVVIFDI